VSAAVWNEPPPVKSPAAGAVIDSEAHRLEPSRWCAGTSCSAPSVLPTDRNGNLLRSACATVYWPGGPLPFPSDVVLVTQNAPQVACVIVAQHGDLATSADIPVISRSGLMAALQDIISGQASVLIMPSDIWDRIDHHDYQRWVKCLLCKHHAILRTIDKKEKAA
jgi:hypothetical protein